MSVKKMTARRLIASLSAVALATGVVTMGTTSGANAAEKPYTGGTLFFYTHADNFPNLDPTRMYTGRDIALFGSYLMRTLVSYKPAKGAAGTTLVYQLTKQRIGHSHFAQELNGKMDLQLLVPMLSMVGLELSQLIFIKKVLPTQFNG